VGDALESHTVGFLGDIAGVSRKQLGHPAKPQADDDQAATFGYHHIL